MNDVITVWKDGTYKRWDATSAHYAQNDPEWLVTIPNERAARCEAVVEAAKKERQAYRGCAAGRVSGTALHRAREALWRALDALEPQP